MLNKGVLSDSQNVTLKRHREAWSERAWVCMTIINNNIPKHLVRIKSTVLAEWQSWYCCPHPRAGRRRSGVCICAIHKMQSATWYLRQGTKTLRSTLEYQLIDMAHWSYQALSFWISLIDCKGEVPSWVIPSIKISGQVVSKTFAVHWRSGGSFRYVLWRDSMGHYRQKQQYRKTRS